MCLIITVHETSQTNSQVQNDFLTSADISSASQEVKKVKVKAKKMKAKKVNPMTTNHVEDVPFIIQSQMEPLKQQLPSTTMAQPGKQLSFKEN